LIGGKKIQKTDVNLQGNTTKKKIILKQKMTTTIVNQIAELLLSLILSDVQVTRTHIQVLQDQLRSLLALKMVLVSEALIRCLSDIVIRRRKQRTIRLPSAVNLLISQYLPIPDARKYLVGTNLLPGQIKNQMEKRWEQREKEYQKLIKDGKYSWKSLIEEENKKGRTLKELKPFITAQNIPDQITRSLLWGYLIEEENKKGRTLKELKPFITAQNIPNQITRSLLWRSLIKEENKKGRTLKELIPFMTAQNIPDRITHSLLWRSLIMEEYKERMSFDELIPFLTEQNIPGAYIGLWFDLIKGEYKKGKRSFDELIPFITAQNIPNREYRSILWRSLIEEEYKKGRVMFNELIPFVTAQNREELRFVLWNIFVREEYEKGGMLIDELLPLIRPKFELYYGFLFPGQE
jgi:biotin operon repressor